jgi:hypothetical protein
MRALSRQGAAVDFAENIEISTSGAEVAEKFASTGAARAELNRWRNRPGLGFVAEKVLAHRSAAVYTVRPGHITSLDTSHALGRIRPAQGYAVSAIKNWYPDFAFTHLLHFCLEDLGRIFSIDEFRQWSSDPQVRDWLWEPAQEALRAAVREGHDADTARAAMQWRIGLMYYSFLREMYAVASLRERGLPVRSHPLADALFRVDAWCGDTVVELFIKNSEFKSGRQGRKKTPADFISPGQPHFNFVRLEMEPRQIWGRVHLPTVKELDRCADAIRLCGPADEGASAY